MVSVDPEAGDSVAVSGQSPGLPDPHPLIPKATAKRGTRRMAPEIRAVIGKKLSRTRSSELIASGAIDPGRCIVVWNVKDRAVKHPVTQVQVPSTADLRPVRRIGTYRGAQSRISMYPVMRGAEVTMVELESQLELHHGIQLSLDPLVGDILAQPFLMLWRHEEGAIVHVPDLAATVDGRLRVFAVKPDDKARDERNRLIFDLAERSLRCGHIEFEILGSMSKQRQINLARLSRYRWPVPTLTKLVGVVHPHAPRSIGGIHRVVREHLGMGGTLHLPEPGCPSLVSLDVALYALAHGWARTNLDEPIEWSTALTWTQKAVW